MARVIGQKMSEILGVAIPVENRTGANGTIAMRQAAQSAPDGYTMTIAGATVMAITPHTTANLGYDPVKDFIGVATVSKSPIVIATNPSVSARTLKELIEMSKGGDLTMGSSGVGGIAHLAIEMFNTAGGKAVHVPYTGGAPAATDVVAGHTKSLAMDLAPLQAFIEDGKMRAIAVVGEGRSIMLPNVPTAIEQGFAGMSADNWYAIVGAGRHAAADRGEAARGGAGRNQCAGGEGETRQDRLRDVADGLARGLSGVPQARARPLGRGREGGGTRRRNRLLHLRAGRLHDRRPFLRFVADEFRGALRRRAFHRVDAELREPLLHLVARHRGIGFAIEPLDDRARRAFRRQHHDAGIGLPLRHAGFGRGRDLRHQRRALRRRRRQRAHARPTGCAARPSACPTA